MIIWQTGLNFENGASERRLNCNFDCRVVCLVAVHKLTSRLFRRLECFCRRVSNGVGGFALAPVCPGIPSSSTQQPSPRNQEQNIRNEKALDDHHACIVCFPPDFTLAYNNNGSSSNQICGNSTFTRNARRHRCHRQYFWLHQSILQLS